MRCDRGRKELQRAWAQLEQNVRREREENIKIIIFGIDEARFRKHLNSDNCEYGSTGKFSTLLTLGFHTFSHYWKGGLNFLSCVVFVCTFLTQKLFRQNTPLINIKTKFYLTWNWPARETRNWPARETRNWLKVFIGFQIKWLRLF